MREQSRIKKKLVIFWRCTYFYDDGKSLGKFTNKMGRRIETVTRIWRTIRTLEIRSNFFGVRVGSKQKITTKVLMVTVFLRQNAKYFRISFWKPLERTALEFKDNKTTNIPHKYEGSNLIWGKTSNTVHTKYKSFYHSVYCLNVTLVSHKRKKLFF